MNRQAMCVLALTLATSARGQIDPSLELTPLVPPPKAPWLKKNQKPPAPRQKKQKPDTGATKAPSAQAKKSKAKKGLQQPAEPNPGAPFVAAPPAGPPPLPLPELVKPPAVAQPKPAETELPLPPLVPLAPLAPIMLTNLGLVFQNDPAGGLPAAAAARVEEGLRGVVKIAPLTRAGPVLPSPAQQCADDACLASLAAPQKLDQLLVTTYANGGLRVRLLDVAQKKQLSSAEQQGVGTDPAEAAAVAEALACKLLVPAGCTGEVSVDTGEGVLVDLDDRTLARGEKRKVAAGMHEVKARAGTKVAQRALPVSREGAPTLYARVVAGEPRLLNSPPEASPVPQAALATSMPAAREGRSWTRPAGITVLALGGAAALTGAIFGAKSKSDLDQSEIAFNRNGGAWRPGDLSRLSSGNSAAKTANVLFIASGALLVTGALLTFAF